jgi:DNA polymerase-3 subunit alpha
MLSNPAEPAFVHLRMHSEFSITDSTIRIDGAISRAVDDQMPALALTDLANLFGAIKFYQNARRNGIKPVIGSDVWISDETEHGRPQRVLLLCQSYAGYLLLSRLLSRAYLENQSHGRAEVRLSWLLDETSGTEGLIALSGARYGGIGQAILNHDPQSAEEQAQLWAALFPDRFYIEIQRDGHDQEEHLLQQSLILASRMNLPVVAGQKRLPGSSISKHDRKSPDCSPMFRPRWPTASKSRGAAIWNLNSASTNCRYTPPRITKAWKTICVTKPPSV